MGKKRYYITALTAVMVFVVGATAFFARGSAVAQSCTDLTFGTVVTSTLASPAEVDCYTFSGTVGDTVRLRISRTSGNFDPTLEVLKDGIPLAGCSDTTTVTSLTLDCDIEASSTHAIFVSDGGADETGDYDLWIQSLSNPLGCVPVTFGDFVSGTLESPAEMDCYSFSGTAGDTVRLQISRTSGNFDPTLEVFKDGIPLAGCSGTTTVTSLTFDCDIATSTTHTIFASDGGGDETGDYDLWTQSLSNPLGCTMVTFGDFATSTLASPAEVDCYTFSGTVGDTVRLRISRTSGNFDPTLEVLKDGIPLAGCSDTTTVTSLTLDCDIEASSTHAIFVSDGGADETGDYDLWIQSLSNPLGCVPVTFGDFVSGTLESPAKMDCYSFSGTAGDTMRLQISRTSGNFDPTLEVFKDGIPLAGCSGTTTLTSLTFDCDIATSTTHAIFASDGGGDETGSYDLSLTCLTIPCDTPGEPDIDVSPLTVLERLPADEMAVRTLSISNLGTADLTWSLAENPEVGWLSEDSIGGTVIAGGSQDIQLTFDTAGLAPNTYFTRLDVSSDDPDEPVVEVRVGLNVVASCTLSLTLDFAVDTLTYTVELGTLEPATWNVWLSTLNDITLQGSRSLGIINPPRTRSLTISGLANSGIVGVLTTMTTAIDGIVCSDWETIDTGPIPLPLG